MTEHSLAHLFRQGEQIVIALDSDACADMTPLATQSEAERGIGLLLEAVARIRSESVFSPNEQLEEIDPENMKYLLTPVYIGSLALKIMDRETRLRNLTATHEYFITFLRQCDMLGLLSQADRDVMMGRAPTDHEAKRQSTIKRYKDSKQAKAHLETLTQHIAGTTSTDASVDSQLSRDHVQALVCVWIHRACDDLAMLREEKNMLVHMEKLREDNDGKMPEPPKNNKPAFKPFVLTKEMVNKGIFGNGYPAQPTMTIEEAAEREHNLGMHGCHGGHDTKMPIVVPAGEDDTTAGYQAEDLDVYKKRNWDAYTDDNPSGLGNRYNRS